MQHCQQSAIFPNAAFSGKHWKLLQLCVTENRKCYIIYFIVDTFHDFPMQYNVLLGCKGVSGMVAAPLPNFLGDLKISDRNNWGGPEQKIKFGWGGGAEFKVRPKLLGGPMNSNDVMVVVLKDIVLCWLGFRFIYVVYVSWYYI